MADRVLAVVGRGVVDVTTPILRGDDTGVARGDGLFETMRVRNRQVFLFANHLRRMAGGAERIGLRLPVADEWRPAVADALAAYGDDIGVLRIYTTRGADGADEPMSYLLVSPVPPAALAAGRDGTHAVTLTLGMSADARSSAPWLLGGVKTMSYAVAMAAKREAEARGGTDAIWISSDGQVLEEATSSIVWIRNGAAFTIPVDTGILSGTTLEHVRSISAAVGVGISDRRTTVEELLSADEVLLLSAVRGVISVLTIDDRPVGAGTIGPIGRQLHDGFEVSFTAATAATGGAVESFSPLG